VTELNAAGSALVYSTYLGGSGTDEAWGLAVDSSGNAYVAGGTTSTDFPTTVNAPQSSNAGGEDAFVTELNSSGSALVYSTYLGGSAGDRGYGVGVDASGNAYVTGYTGSTDFPTAHAHQGTLGGAGANNAFVAKLAPPPPAQPLNAPPGQPGELTYNYGPYTFVVDYTGDDAYSGYSLKVTDVPTTLGQFQNRVLGTGYANTTCSIFNGTEGKCVIFEATCENTASGAPATCPTPSPENSVHILNMNWDTTDDTSGWNLSNTAFLKADIGENNWQNIETFVSGTRTDGPDPTGSGRTKPSFSDFVFVYNVSGTPPGITITSPQNNAVYAQNENVPAAYSCSGTYQDCIGNVPVGSAIDTSTPGGHTFTVNAPVSSGPAGVQAVNYQVSSTVSAESVSINAPAIIYGGAASVTVSVTSDAGIVTGNVSLAVDGGTPLTQALWNGSTVFTISSLGGGTHNLSANYAAQGAFGSNSAAGTLQVNPASQTITVTTAAPGAANDGVAFSVGATASSTLPVAITTLGACVGSGSGSANITMISGTGTCVVYFDQAGNANYSAAPEVTNSTTAMAGPVASISPLSINFGNVYLLLAAVRSLTLTNTGNASMSVGKVKVSGGNDSDDFIPLSLCPSTLAAGKSCTIIVTFTADNDNYSPTGTLSVPDNAPRSPQTVLLSGTVINPKASLSAYSLSFSKQKVGTTSVAQTVTLTNKGTTSLLLGTLTINGDFAFASGTTCGKGGSLAPNTPCTINVTFTPTALGSRSGKVVITDNALLSPQIVLLSGSGIGH
jgi:hypothetical protein